MRGWRSSSVGLSENPKRVPYRKWEVGARCGVTAEVTGVRGEPLQGVIVAVRTARQDRCKVYEVALDADAILSGAATVTVTATAHQLTRPVEHRTCAICERSFTCAPGVNKKTCSAECAEEYQRTAARTRGRGR